jgi:hypothetical protein
MRRIVAIRCQAVVGVRGRLPPSGDRWLRGMGRIVAIRCQAVVGVRGRLPPSGDRWLRRQVATATGGYGDRWPRRRTDRTDRV